MRPDGGMAGRTGAFVATLLAGLAAGCGDATPMGPTSTLPPFPVVDPAPPRLVLALGPYLVTIAAVGVTLQP